MLLRLWFTSQTPVHTDTSKTRASVPSLPVLSARMASAQLRCPQCQVSALLHPSAHTSQASESNRAGWGLASPTLLSPSNSASPQLASTYSQSQSILLLVLQNAQLPPALAGVCPKAPPPLPSTSSVTSLPRLLLHPLRGWSWARAVVRAATGEGQIRRRAASVRCGCKPDGQRPPTHLCWPRPGQTAGLWSRKVPSGFSDLTFLS